MDPFTATLMALAGGTAAAGKLFEGFGASDAGMLKAKIAQQNAELSRLAAAGELENIPLVYAKAGVDEGRVRERLAGILSGQTGHFASTNFDPAYGSPLVMQAEAAGRGETDARLVRANAALEESKVRGRAQALESQGSAQALAALQAKSAADAARIAGYFGAGSALLGGAAKAWPAFGGGSAPTYNPGTYNPGYGASSITAGGNPYATYG